MDKRKIMLSLTDEALTALSDHASARKRGELASKAILAYVNQPTQEASILERIEQRLVKLEAALADSMAVSAAGKKAVCLNGND